MKKNTNIWQKRIFLLLIAIIIYFSLRFFIELISLYPEACINTFDSIGRIPCALDYAAWTTFTPITIFFSKSLLAGVALMIWIPETIVYTILFISGYKFVQHLRKKQKRNKK